jgi:hypothetical protein
LTKTVPAVKHFSANEMDGSVTEWLTLALLVINGVGVPLIIFFVGQQRLDRKAQFEAMHERLTHLDDCIDTVQKLVIGKAVTREELVAMKAEINETLTRMRAAVSIETSGLHDRLMRLERPHFQRVAEC